MFSKKIAVLLVVAVLLGLVAACGGAAPEPEVVTVVETVIVEKEVEGETVTVVETVEVEKEVIKEVEVEKLVEVAPEDPDAGRIRVDAVTGTEPPSLDPSLATDTTSPAPTQDSAPIPSSRRAPPTPPPAGLRPPAAPRCARSGPG